MIKSHAKSVRLAALAALLGSTFFVPASPSPGESGSAAEITSVPPSHEFADQFRDLLANDPAVRIAARTSLEQAGPRAAQALRGALKHPSPIVRREASRLIDLLPRNIPGDSPGVVAILSSFGQSTPELRRELIGRLSTLPSDQSQPVLMRLLLSEPEGMASWYIATVLMRTVSREQANALAAVDRGTASAPCCFLAGWALRHQDRPAARELFQIAQSRATMLTSDSQVLLRLANQIITEMDTRAGNFNDALARMRQSRDRPRTGRSSVEDVRVAKAMREFAAREILLYQARHGISDQLAGDLFATFPATYAKDVIPVWAAVLQKSRSLRLLGDAMYSFIDSLASRNRLKREAVEVLMSLEQFGRARAFMERFPNPNRQGIDVSLLFATMLEHRQSGNLQSERDAISRLRPLINIEAQFGTSRDDPMEVPRVITGADYRISLAARMIDISAKLNELDQAAALIDELTVNQPIANSPLLTEASEVIPALIKLGRAEDAKSLFEKRYEKLIADIARSPEHPMLLNETAWLCAIAKNNLTEALVFASRAVEIEPRAAGFIDTLALVIFEMGDVDGAIKMQRRALELEPNNVELSDRLKQFESHHK